MNGKDIERDYGKLMPQERRALRKKYTELQGGKCFFCGEPLSSPPPERITCIGINWGLFPENFLEYPVHLQHNHLTGMTEGAVHAYCNAVMWQYYGW